MVYLCTHVLEPMLALADVILGGTLERFPQLRVGAAEAHVQWVPGWLSLLDRQFGAATKIYTKDSGEVALKFKPSEYFRRQCFVAAFADDSMIPEAIAAAPDSIVVCSDWPHPVSDEYAKDGLRSLERHSHLTPESRRRLLTSNPTRFI